MSSFQGRRPPTGLVFALALGSLLGVSGLQLQPVLPNAQQLHQVWLACAVVFALWLMSGWLTTRRSLQQVLRANSVQGIYVVLRFILILTLAAGLMLIYTTQWAERELAKRLPAELDQQSVALDVVIVDLPTRHERGWRFEVQVLTPGLPSRGVLNWYVSESGSEPGSEPHDDTLRLAPGQRWQLQAKVRRAAGTLNPGGFDLEAWMLEKQLYFSGTVQQGKRQAAPVRLADADGFLIRIDQLRDRIRTRIDALLKDDVARHVLNALVVGDQRAISTQDWALFQRTGVSHLMSISGLHVTMLAGLASFLGAWVWRRLCVWPISAGLYIPVQSVAAASAAAGAMGYALLAGFAIPAQRTALMVMFLAIARLSGLKADHWAVISLALMAVLLTDPMACLAPGFWLSFFAVALLFSLGEASTEKVTWPRRVWAMVKTASHAQLAITFGLLPITVLLFQQVVVIGPLANALVIPVVSFVITPLAMLASLVAAFSDADALLRLASWVYQLLYQFLMWCASLEWSRLDWPSPGLERTVASSLGMLVALGSLFKKWLGHGRHAGWLALGLLWVPPAAAPAHGEMEVTFIDVGQGSSVLVRTAHHTLLVDTGPKMGGSDAGERMVLPTLRRMGIRRLDQLMVSHFDDDHAGGVNAVLANMQVSEMRFPDAEAGPAVVACQAGQRWSWDGVTFVVLHPASAGPVSKDRNARSCVLHISSTSGSLLLAGDLPARQEKLLVHQFTGLFDAEDEEAMRLAGATLSAQVLLAPHHGSHTSTSPELLQAVTPGVVVIQAGYRNRFGHPHAEVMSRIAHLQVLRTDLQGAITLRWPEPGGQPQAQDFFATHRRYWHITREP